MRKTLRTIIVEAVGVSFDENLKLVEKQLEPFIYEGRKMTAQALKREFAKQGNFTEILIKSEKEVVKTYEYDLKDFLEIAVEVEEEKEN